MVATDDGTDPDYRRTREAGMELAESDGASLLLYDRTSESYLTDPYPAGPWSPEEDAVSESTELDREMLHNLGRDYLVEQLDESERRGVFTRVHMARGTGAEAMAEAVQRYDPDLLILPQSMDNPSLLNRVVGNTLKRLRSKVDVDIRLVDEDGEIHHT